MVHELMSAFAFTGYENFVQIHDSINSQVYRARRAGDRQPVIVKFLNRDYPTSEQIRRYKQEYYLTCQLNSPGVVKAYSLEEWQRSYAIVLEDFGGIALKQWLKQRGEPTLPEFLFLAIAIAESLGQIHARHIIHKDINPANIIFNSKTKELKMIDFGISTQLSRENPTPNNPKVLEGTLAYISPEQTGRMNRILDYRTDFYSLGVTFYEMLTGKLPFESTDPLELIHCHIAKSPPAIASHRPSVPQTIANIVAKLMAKNAEDRYQSAGGLKADLETCLKQFEDTGNIAIFPLAQRDISDRFQIPQKLYGREEEVATLLAAFDRVANPSEATLDEGKTGGVELMLVAGYSGIGKSSLVQELYKPITARRGYFISGKFDQFQRNIPYSALVSAFQELIGQLLGESEQQLQVWREKILKALGNNGGAIVDVIPKVELIIGKQPPVPELGAIEAQNRFNLVFGNFIHVFCEPEHPLTLFLDDLQWADLATLQLMERMLVEEKNQYLLLLGAYRDNEVFAGHPLAIALEKLQRSNATINQIKLKPLPLECITGLIGDTLQQTSKILHLARLVLQKTEGNPFFVNEFLQALYSEGLLHFDRKARSWKWDIAAIEARGFTDNVVELMVAKLQQLPASSQEILSFAACLGAEFSLTTLTWIAAKPPQEIFELLKIALDRGFILPLSELDENLLVQSYKFGHDRIQQAAYALIPDESKETTHYHIGQLLLQKIPLETREERIFELVNQLNHGIACVSEREERDELARLNLIACRKARTAAAYPAGREYADIGLSLLGAGAWQRKYEMTLAFHNLAAELASLCGDFEAMERFVETVIARARSVLDRIDVYRIEISSKVSQHKPTEAITIAQELLQQLGMTFPTHPTEKDIRQSIAEIEQLLGGRKIEDLASLPMMADSEQIAIIEIVNSIIPAAYISGSSLYLLLVTLSVKVSIQYGNTSASIFAYANYGMVACNLERDVETGVRFGQLALQLVSQLDAKAIKSGILHVAGFFLLHRKSHIKKTLPLSQEGYLMGLEFGNLEFAGYNAHHFCLNAFWCGQPLALLEQEIRTYCNALVQLNQSLTANYCRIFWQSVLNLLNVVERPGILSGDVLQETELLPLLTTANDLCGLFYFYLYKLMLCYLFGDMESAKHHGTEIDRYLAGETGTVGRPAFYFYDSLAVLAVPSPESEERSEALQRADEHLTILQQQWARHAPMNHQHRVELITAEKCRVLGRKEEAIERYNKAIALAKENEYIQEEALANELTAKFYLDWNQQTAARAYMMEARYCYGRWGATAKVKHLEETYPQLCQSSATRTPTTYSNHFSDPTAAQQTREPHTASNSHINLDLTTFMKASQTIACEIVLSQLLTQLIKILLENTGAQSGFLLLKTKGELLIEAEARADGEVAVLQSIPLEFTQPDGTSPLLCSAVINYVARTQESLVLKNARHEGNFTNQPYIQKFQVKSVLCVPLVNRGRLRGVAYLENNLTTGAFTQERVEIVQLLSGQAAIAISNAQLYSQLQDSERQLKRLYDASKRFVPAEFLSFLEKESIVDVDLGDQVEREMAVLFSDIRDFTTLSEQMTPAENFAFINEYLGYMEPQIRKYRGFIDKYIGDAIMALFPNSADDAVKGAIAMLQELKKYNSVRQERNLRPIRIGIGLHSGLLMLGTVGGMGRMDGTAIGDSVNLSSRVEGLTKVYGVSLLITQKTLARLNDPLEYDLRFIEKVHAKGKAKAVGLFEIFSADPPELREAKIATKEKFERAVLLHHRKFFQEAARLFQDCVEYCEGDRAARNYLERCQQQIA